MIKLKGTGEEIKRAVKDISNIEAVTHVTSFGVGDIALGSEASRTKIPLK